MTSPFADFVNAILTFKVPSTTAVNSLGNPEGAVTEFVVKAMLKRNANRQPTNILSPGSDVDLVLLRGRCVDPIALPLAIVAESVAIAEIDDMVGEFTLSAIVQSPSVPKEVLGQAIEGYFRVRKIWGDTL